MVGRGSLMELTDAMDRSTLQRIGEGIGVSCSDAHSLLASTSQMSGGHTETHLAPRLHSIFKAH